MTRPKIARLLREQPSIAKKLEAARTIDEGQTHFGIEADRVRNVLRKLVLGHAAFELEEHLLEAELHLDWAPLAALDEATRERFETPPERSQLLPEIGSRAQQKAEVVIVTLAPADGAGEQKQIGFLLDDDWITVQDGQYRYLAALTGDGRVLVRLVLSEFLACEASWET